MNMKTPTEAVIEAYAHTNNPPSDFDRIFITQLVDEERDAVASLDAEISEARAHLAKLCSRREKRNEDIKNLCGISSPLRYLPAEILSLIFVHCPRAEPQWNRKPNFHVAPLLLVQICSRWRHVALATPMLWTELQLYLTRRTEYWGMIFMNNWLINAAQLPISLVVECHDNEVLRRALSTQTRWFKELHLKVSPSSLNCLGTKKCSGLDAETVRIEVTPVPVGGDIPARERNTYNAFRASSSLRSFSLLSTAPGRTIFPKFLLPWSQLTELCIDAELSSSSVTIFLHCTNLTRCIFGTIPLLDEVHDRQPTTFPSLTDAHLIFEYLDVSTFNEFFRPLIAPSLKKLAFHSYETRTEWSMTFFPSFQFRSAFNLETLEVHISIEAYDLHVLLAAIPTLSILTLMKISVTESIPVFSVLTWDGPHSLLPHLKRLKLALNLKDEPLQPFLAMVKSRYRTIVDVSRLISLHLVSYQDTSSLDRWWWQWKLEAMFPELDVICSDGYYNPHRPWETQ
ncbi:hypothetical protein C8J57DRAFT_726782 [Mycena rebaudengoi]|nr:hypothetical protein C8J57DRAFT_726782 [Mycena rebaudengoi]